MLKVMTIVGTRPEIIKLSCVIQELDIYTDHTLVHTGQNYDYELNELFFEQLDIRKPNYFLEAIKSSPSNTIADIISKTDKIIEKIKPEAILLYGDTNSCLSVISAKKRKIPIFHMEAGNRCFDQRVPEEVNRKIVDHISDINMPLSEHARRYLISEGIKPETIFKIGSPMKEVLNKNIDKIKSSKILEIENLKPKEYFLISLHREENVDSETNLKNLLDSINQISIEYKFPIIISTHPRTRKMLQNVNFNFDNNIVRFSKPFGFHDYNHLQMNAFCVISDSGTITEETSILNLTSITIREAHERPEGMDEGTLIMTGLKKHNILESIKIVTDQNIKNNKLNSLIGDYEVESVSRKVVRIICSYVDYVNRTVWSKI